MVKHTTQDGRPLLRQPDQALVDDLLCLLYSEHDAGSVAEGLKECIEHILFMGNNPLDTPILEALHPAWRLMDILREAACRQAK